MGVKALLSNLSRLALTVVKQLELYHVVLQEILFNNFDCSFVPFLLQSCQDLPDLSNVLIHFLILFRHFHSLHAVLVHHAFLARFHSKKVLIHFYFSFIQRCRSLYGMIFTSPFQLPSLIACRCKSLRQLCRQG